MVNFLSPLSHLGLPLIHTGFPQVLLDMQETHLSSTHRQREPTVIGSWLFAVLLTNLGRFLWLSGLMDPFTCQKAKWTITAPCLCFFSFENTPDSMDTYSSSTHWCALLFEPASFIFAVKKCAVAITRNCPLPGNCGYPHEFKWALGNTLPAEITRQWWGITR